MYSNPFYDVSYPWHGSFDPLRPFSFIPPCLKSSPKQDQVTTYIVELVDNQNNLTTLALSKDDTSIKVIKNGVVTSNVEPIENQEKNCAIMLSKDPCQDQSLSSSCSTTSCSLPLSTLPKSLQASKNPIKQGAPIQDVHDPIENPNAHSKDADILGCYIHADQIIDYLFASSMSILGPPPPILRASHFPSILGPYVPSLSPPK